jgi:FKBP-type peptidyl-prolyl cis-trans isomerase (trigger factor)
MSKKPTITKDEKRWELVLTGEIAAENIAEHRSHVLAELKKDAHLPGFRPGKAPEEQVLKTVGEDVVLHRTIEHAVHHELPEMLAAADARIVASPQVTVEKAPSSFPATEPIVFTARAPMAPEIKLPDYKKIAAKHNKEKAEVEVTDKEHQETLNHLKRERARITKVELGLSPQEAMDQARAMEEKDLPDLDDEFVKSLGYESAEKFTDAVKTNIKNEKELREVEKRRAAMLDELVKEAKISYPAMLLEFELDDMEARMQDDIQRMGLTMEKYLAETKKTKEEIRESWKEAADNRAKMRLVLSQIAQEEKIDADQERYQKELSHAKEHYPNADESNLSAHISHALRNEAVITWLEQQK